jgi:hypothetical protein
LPAQIGDGTKMFAAIAAARLPRIWQARKIG